MRLVSSPPNMLAPLFLLFTRRDGSSNSFLMEVTFPSPRLLSFSFFSPQITSWLPPDPFSPSFENPFLASFYDLFPQHDPAVFFFFDKEFEVRPPHFPYSCSLFVLMRLDFSPFVFEICRLSVPLVIGDEKDKSSLCEGCIFFQCFFPLLLSFVIHGPRE